MIQKYKSGESVDGNLIDSTWKFRIETLEAGLKNKFQTSGYDDKSWKEINGTVLYTSQGYSHKGWSWYRKNIQFPEIPTGKRLLLTLGAVDESYELYVNGTLANSFKYDSKKNPDSWKQPQTIDISDYVVQRKLNTLALAVHNMAAAGGLWKDSYWKIALPSS